MAKLTRFEVIDHRTGGFGGRTLIAGSPVANPDGKRFEAEVVLQDDGATMKVFLSDIKE